MRKEATTRRTGGSIPSTNPANAETLKALGDVTTATSTIPNTKIASAETKKTTGVAKTAILTSPSTKTVSVETSNDLHQNSFYQLILTLFLIKQTSIQLKIYLFN